MSYVYDIVRHDLRHRHTTSYVPHVRCRNVRCAYDIIKTYDVVRHNNNVVRYSSYAKSKVESITSYATSHTMFTLFCSGRSPGDPNPYCCICARHLTAFGIAVFVLQCIAHNSSRHRFCRAAAWAAASGLAAAPGSATAAPPDASPSSSSSYSYD